MPRPIERRLPLFAIFISFRVLWGGGGHPPPPPPPGRAKVAQTPGRARVKFCSSALSLHLNSACHLAFAMATPGLKLIEDENAELIIDSLAIPTCESAVKQLSIIITGRGKEDGAGLRHPGHRDVP